MKKFFENMTIYTKTFVISLAAGVFVSLVLLILGLCNLLSLFIPLGIILGTLLSSLSYFALGKIENIDCDANRKLKLSMTVIYVRLALLILIEVTEVLLQYFGIVKLFDPIGFLGAFFFTFVVFLICSLGEKHANRA